MKKKLALITSIVGMSLLSGCTASYEDQTCAFNLSPELKDYKVIKLSSTDGTYLYVLVKREKEDRPVIGTVRTGKYPVHTITIDEKKYQLIETEK